MGGANSSKDSRDDLVIVSDRTMEYDSHWTLDLAYSHNYTSHRKWFASYKVAGVGTVRVRMYDRVIKTLTNIKHEK